MPIIANIRLKKTENGGRKTSISSNYRPAFYFNDLYHDCYITILEKNRDIINPGEECVVQIDYIKPENIPQLSFQTTFILTEGNKIIANGYVLLEEVTSDYINVLHDKAMDYIESSFTIKRMKVYDKKDVEKLCLSAYYLATAAAMCLEKLEDAEPTRSVIFKSAAWCAWDVGFKNEAKLLAEDGLRFCIHEELKKELQEIIDNCK